MSRPGLSRLDLLVILVLVFAAIGLITPAILKVQETQRRTDTNNNLKKCALAVHAFHDVYRRLPDAYNKGGKFVDNPVSFWFHLLPYVDARDVYEQAKIDAVVPAFEAPSDLSTWDRAGTISFGANIRVFAYNSLTPVAANSVNRRVDVPGGILKSNLTFPRIVDGTTNTLMILTRYADCDGKRTWYGTDALGQSSLGAVGSPGFGGFAGAGESTTPAATAGPMSAMFQITPTRNQCLPEGAVFGHSFGNDGISVALCDGSAKVIKLTISTTAFARALSPGDQIPFFGREDDD